MNDDAEDYSEVTAQYLLKKMKEDKRVVTITSGTPAVLGFTPDRRQEAGKQFVDVGIAEEHAVALASGIAANGGNRFTECTAPLYNALTTSSRKISASIIIRQFCWYSGGRYPI